MAKFIGKRSKFSVFVHTVPCGCCTVLAVVVVMALILTGRSCNPVGTRRGGTVRKSLFAAKSEPFRGTARGTVCGGKGMVSLIFPVLSLVMYYMVKVVCSNNFFSKANFMRTFSKDSTSIKLVLKDFFTVMVAVIFCTMEGILHFSSSVTYVPRKFGTVIPTVLVLAFT